MSRAVTPTKATLAPMEELARPIAIVEELAEKYALGALKSKGKLERAVMLARGMVELREAMTAIMPQLLPLMNAKLGFLTDRDPRRSKQAVEPYPVEVVRDCLIEGLLRGVYPVNNEINIISGGCYITKEGLERLVREIPGLTDLKVSTDPPRVREGGAVVRVAARWKMGGKPDQLIDTEGKPGVDIAVRLNAGMGADAATGKAERKAYARIYRQITDTELTDGDVTDALPAPARAALTSRTEQVAEKLGAAPAANGGQLFGDKEEPTERETTGTAG